MNLHDIGLILLAFLSELIGTVSGFGSSTFFVPAALLVESFHFVLVLTALLHCFGNISRIIMFRAHFNWDHFIRLAIPSILLCALGALFAVSFSVELLKVSLGSALVLVSVFLFFGKSHIQRLPFWVASVLSAISGFMTGLVGTGGAIRGVALTALGIEKSSFVVLSASIDFGGDLLRTVIYLRSHFMDWSQWFYIPLLIAAALLGARAGQRLLNRLSQDQFEKVMCFFVLLSGIVLLVKH